MYLLDSNVFIEAKDGYYGLDFAPGFWDWLIQENIAGNVASIKQVESEICAGSDELSEWAKERGETFFLHLEPIAKPAFNKVGSWAHSQNYSSLAVDKFLNAADSWLIACALKYSYVVVTHETTKQASKKIKIPIACFIFNIRCIDTFEMLREQKARFVLDSTKSDIISVNNGI